jgi:hypothetical protein
MRSRDNKGWKWWPWKKEKKKKKKTNDEIQPQPEGTTYDTQAPIEEAKNVSPPSAPAHQAPIEEANNVSPPFAPAHQVVSQQLAYRAPSPLQLPPSPPRAYILNFLPDLLRYISTLLDPRSLILLSLTCKKLYAFAGPSIPALYAPLFPVEKLSILRLFPPARDPDPAPWPAQAKEQSKERAPPHLCRLCLLYHTTEYLIMYPHPRPERVFLSYKDFAVQKPRVCVRDAVKRGRWAPGGDMGDGEHVLCAECWTPMDLEEGMCSWNCKDCGKCTGRERWGIWCVDCAGLNGGEGNLHEMALKAVAGLWLGRPVEKDIVKSEPLAGELWKPEW